MASPAIATDALTPVSPHPAWSAAAQRLPAVRAVLASTAESMGPLAPAARLHLAHPGKLGRSRLALACCDALGVAPGDGVALAVACELLHNASLVHDDVQDRDRLRRGRPAIWSVYGDAVAINLGDDLLTRALRQASRVGADPTIRLTLVDLFTRATSRAIGGQVWDCRPGAALETDPEVYEEIALRKTGALLALPAEAALALAGRDAAEQELARCALQDLAVAFQIQDDLLDLLGRQGREPGSDLLAGRPSAPLVHFLAAASGADRDSLARFWRGEPRCRQSHRGWLERIRESRAVDAALARFAQRAQAGLDAAAALGRPLDAVLGEAAAELLRLGADLESPVARPPTPAGRTIPIDSVGGARA